MGDLAEIDEEAGGTPPVPADDNRRITGGGPPDSGEAAQNGGALPRDAGGRFVAGTAAGEATRFSVGKSGNPKGRPKGSRRWLSRREVEKFRSGARVAAALLDAEAERITRTAIDAALGGDAVAARFCLGRVLGTRRGQPVELALPEIAAPRDLSGAVAAITAALAGGRLTPDEAHACARMLDGLPRVLAAARADAPRWEGGEDPRKTLARKLARLAKSVEENALRQSQALATIPGSSAAGPPAAVSPP